MTSHHTSVFNYHKYNESDIITDEKLYPSLDNQNQSTITTDIAAKPSITNISINPKMVNAIVNNSTRKQNESRLTNAVMDSSTRKQDESKLVRKLNNVISNIDQHDSNPVYKSIDIIPNTDQHNSNPVYKSIDVMSNMDQHDSNLIRESNTDFATYHPSMDIQSMDMLTYDNQIRNIRSICRQKYLSHLYSDANNMVGLPYPSEQHHWERRIPYPSEQLRGERRIPYPSECQQEQRIPYPSECQQEQRISSAPPKNVVFDAPSNNLDGISNNGTVIKESYYDKYNKKIAIKIPRHK